MIIIGFIIYTRDIILGIGDTNFIVQPFEIVNSFCRHTQRLLILALYHGEKSELAQAFGQKRYIIQFAAYSQRFFGKRGAFI
jgi:hypothetical protein